VTPVTVHLSLGSNLGDRCAQIRAALAELERRGVRAVHRSSFYETEPVGFSEQPWFVNIVVRAETGLTPAELLRACQVVERSLGRRPTARFGPRTIDVDLLLYGNAHIVENDLVVPHPRLCERRFVLVPLLEISPDAVDPVDGQRFADVLSGLDEGKKVHKLPTRES